MYIYANADGKIKEIVNDLALRQANDNINHIYLYCENIPTQGISAGYIRYQLPDGTITTEVQFSLTTVRKIIPYNKKRDLRYFKDYQEYDFYDITIPNGEDEDVENVLQDTGLVRATIRFVDSSESTIYALETIPFYVEDSVVRKTEYINGDQYNYLLKIIPSEYLKSAVITNSTLKITNSEGQEINYTTIDDNNISSTTTFSSNKIKNMFTAGTNVIITFNDVNKKFVISATTEPVGSVAWGGIVGNIDDQLDLKAKFDALHLYVHSVQFLKTFDNNRIFANIKIINDTNTPFTYETLYNYLHMNYEDRFVNIVGERTDATTNKANGIVYTVSTLRTTNKISIGVISLLTGDYEYYDFESTTVAISDMVKQLI